MNKDKDLLLLEKIKTNISKKSKKEELLFFNPNKYNLKKRRNKKTIIKLLYIIIVIIIIIILLLLLLFLFIDKKLLNKNNVRKVNIFDKYNVIYNKFSVNENDIVKYKDMLPRLTPNNNSPIPTIDEIFNSREIYISDTRITPDYIKFIRPVNENDEKKYKKRFSEGDTIIDKILFKKRPDQLDYNNYCKLSLEEKLMDDNKLIELERNKPLISIVISSHNKENLLLKSVRSIQNQKYKNIEIIIVNDCSNDNSIKIFNYLLKTDPRVRIIHHMKNMGCWRTRLEGMIYSKGKYVILFDAGDLYEDNYVLIDALNVIETYNLDSCKFLFRVIRSFDTLQNSVVYFHVGDNAKIVYETPNIYQLNRKVFTTWGNTWNRLIRDNICSKAIYLLNESLLNLHKNLWDDVWFNEIVHKSSYSYAVFERVGYVYLQDWGGEGCPRYRTEEEKSKMVKEFVGFLQFDYNFADNKGAKNSIINKLRDYNERNNKFRLSNFKAHFEVLNELLEKLIKDPDISLDDKKYCEELLAESIKREKEINQKK